MPKDDLINTKPVDLAKILQEYHDFLKKLNEQEKEQEPIKEKKRSGGSVGSLIDKSLHIQPKELRDLVKKIRVNLESGGNPTNKKEELEYMISLLSGMKTLTFEDADLLEKLLEQLKNYKKN
jgi:hypothetical protein